MINIGNVENSKQINQASKSAEKLSENNKIDAVQNIQVTKKVQERKNDRQKDKKNPASNKAGLLKQPTIQDKQELDNEVYDSNGKRQVSSKINLKV